MNRCILIGRVTTNIELKESQSGTKNISFSLAVPRNFKNSEGVTETDFISCKAFAKTAETIAKYVKKGNKLGVCGSVQCSSYTNEEGKTIYRTDIIVNEIEFCQAKGESSTPVETTPKVEESDPFSDFGDQISIDDDFLN